MRKLKFETIFGQVPCGPNCYQVVADAHLTNGQRLVKSDAVRGYEHGFIQQCAKYANRQILGRFRLLITIYDGNSNNELDEALRTVLNCLQYVKAVADKSKCAETIARKVVDVRYPRIEFALQEITEPIDIAALGDILSRESDTDTKGGKVARRENESR